jgi:SRSO17 transposase
MHMASTADVALRRLDLRLARFLHPYHDLFTHRRDGTSWPRRDNTLRNAKAYLRGLLAPGKNKNMANLARRTGIPEDRLERFVRDSPWDHDTLQTHLVQNLPEAIRSPEAALVLDDFGIEKQGKHSVGTHRQYSGTLGKTGNCQVAVNLTYARPAAKNKDQVTWPLGTELYMPRVWLEDPDHEDLRVEVGVPDDLEFKTKQEIALELLERACEHGLSDLVTLGDAEYGHAGVRRFLRERNQAYVLGVQPSHLHTIPPEAPLEPGPTGVLHYPEGVEVASPKQLADQVEVWHQVDWTEGTKGRLKARFARVRVRVTERSASERRATNEVSWLLLEKRSNELKAYLCWGLDDASLEDLVALAHLRWTIEQFHREAKGLVGLDRFEGRSWQGWHHHIALVLLAYAFMALVRAEAGAIDLPPLSEVAGALAREHAAQDLMREHGLSHAEATRYADTALRGVIPWYR